MNPQARRGGSLIVHLCFAWMLVVMLATPLQSATALSFPTAQELIDRVRHDGSSHGPYLRGHGDQVPDWEARVRPAGVRLPGNASYIARPFSAGGGPMDTETDMLGD